MNKRKIKIVFILLFTVSFNVFSQDTINYKGDLDVNGINMPITLQVIQTKDTTLYFLGSPSQTKELFKASKVKYYNDSVSIGIKSMGIVIKGKYNDKKDIFSTNFKQGFFQNPLIFTLQKQAFTFYRPQTPKPPFNYNEQELSFKNPECKYTFYGTLTYPKQKQKYPVVILLSGSGLQNRDEEIFSHKPFAVIADYLTKKGIAVFRYDDRGWGQKDTNLMRGNTIDFKKDCESAIQMLKTNENIDTNFIGIIGHSEGGLIAEIIASERKDIAFIVLMAAPAISGKDILLTQTRKILLSNNTKEEDIKKAEKQIKNMKFENNDINTYWMKCFYNLNPKDYLKNIHCPTLVLNGSKDMQVIAEDNIPQMKKYLHNKSIIKVMPNLNHLFQHCTSGNPKEYVNIEETISTEVLKEISDFILSIKNK